MARILQHNYDDLYYMLDILKILDIIKDKKSIAIVNKDDTINLSIDNLNILGDQLLVNGKVHDKKIVKLIYYGNNYSIYFDADFNFEIRIETSSGMVAPHEKGIYIDTKKYLLPNLSSSPIEYDLPLNILLLKVDKQFIIENIKNLLIEIISFALNNS